MTEHVGPILRDALAKSLAAKPAKAAAGGGAKAPAKPAPEKQKAAATDEPVFVAHGIWHGDGGEGWMDWPSLRSWTRKHFIARDEKFAITGDNPKEIVGIGPFIQEAIKRHIVALSERINDVNKHAWESDRKRFAALEKRIAALEERSEKLTRALAKRGVLGAEAKAREREARHREP